MIKKTIDRKDSTSRRDIYLRGREKTSGRRTCTSRTCQFDQRRGACPLAHGSGGDEPTLNAR
ncbi:MAG: hypothetical protein ACFFD4_34330 [Candidatus Odinarchaeota archaeon]